MQSHHGARRRGHRNSGTAKKVALSVYRPVVAHPARRRGIETGWARRAWNSARAGRNTQPDVEGIETGRPAPSARRTRSGRSTRPDVEGKETAWRAGCSAGQPWPPYCSATGRGSSSASNATWRAGAAGELRTQLRRLLDRDQDQVRIYPWTRQRSVSWWCSAPGCSRSARTSGSSGDDPACALRTAPPGSGRERLGWRNATSQLRAMRSARRPAAGPATLLPRRGWRNQPYRRRPQAMPTWHLLLYPARSRGHRNGRHVDAAHLCGHRHRCLLYPARCRGHRNVAQNTQRSCKCCKLL
jgi:hypothetical protein